MYRVTTYFIDLQDGEHPYNVGDAFPREGHTVSEARIKELSGFANKRKKPLIELVDEPVIEPEPEKEEKPRRLRAKKEPKDDGSGSSVDVKGKSRKKK